MSSEPTVTGVPRGALPQVWPVVEPLLRPALARDAAIDDMGEVFDALDTERCMLWLVEIDDAVVGALVIHLAGPRLVVWLMGGRDFDEWHKHVEGLLRRYAVDYGCELIQANVRPGLGRKLTGWRKRSELVEMRV